MKICECRISLEAKNKWAAWRQNIWMQSKQKQTKQMISLVGCWYILVDRMHRQSTHIRTKAFDGFINKVIDRICNSWIKITAQVSLISLVDKKVSTGHQERLQVPDQGILWHGMIFVYDSHCLSAVMCCIYNVNW